MGLATERISGSDRYETSVKIAEKLSGQTNTAVVVYGKNFPDSLAIAAHAAQNGYPILLTKTDSLPSGTKKVLSKYKNTIVVGGTGVISEKLMNDLPNAKRYSGKDRYDTVSKVVNGLNVKFGDSVYVATGQSFADALTGSVLAAKKNSSLVLVQKDKVPSPVQSVLSSVNSSNASIIGGMSAVSSSVESKLGFNTDALVKTAKQYLGTPYQYGGTTPSGFDCSGFIQYVFGKHSIKTPRTTSDLYAGGKSVSKPEVGDIVFFRTDPNKSGASHAGIYIGDNKFIHAKSAGSNIGVTIDEMSNSYFSPIYLGAKRYH
jgi:cell wall-associated NlpC family hydrolase